MRLPLIHHGGELGSRLGHAVSIAWLGAEGTECCSSVLVVADWLQ